MFSARDNLCSNHPQENQWPKTACFCSPYKSIPWNWMQLCKVATCPWFCLEQLHFYTQHLPLQQYFSHLELLMYCWPSLTHLSMKEGSLFVLFYFVLFCLYWWDSPNRDASDSILGLFGKLLRRRGASAWFHGVWTCGAKVLEYWMISSLKIKLNCSWKFRRNWNVPLVLLERSWWAGFNGIYLVRFGFRMMGDNDF